MFAAVIDEGGKRSPAVTKKPSSSSSGLFGEDDLFSTTSKPITR